MANNVNKNPHSLIDNISNILLLLELESGKILSAYTSEAFSVVRPKSSDSNVAIIIDVT